MGVIEKLVEEDYGLEGHGRWLRSLDHSSLVVDAEKQIFFFNAKDLSGGPMIYLMKVRGMSFSEARQYLKQFKDYKESFVYTADNVKEDTIVYPPLIDIFWEEGKRDRTYWYKRGFTDATIDKFQLGKYTEWSTIPIYFKNTFRNFQLRRDAPKVIRPYYRGIGILPFNFDILKLVDRVVIVEGPTNCIRIMQEGIPCVSQTGGAINWITEWFPYFVDVKEIYINYDNDDAGINGAIKVAKILGETKCKLYCFQEKEEQKGYDVIDFFNEGGTRSQYLDLLNNSSKYSFELEQPERKKWNRSRY